MPFGFPSFKFVVEAAPVETSTSGLIGSGFCFAGGHPTFLFRRASNI